MRQGPSLARAPVLAGSMIVSKRNTAVLAALAVIVLPGGSLLVGAVWLYRYVRLAGSRAA